MRFPGVLVLLLSFCLLSSGFSEADELKTGVSAGLFYPIEGSLRGLYLPGVQTVVSAVAPLVAGLPLEAGVDLGYDFQFLRAADTLSLADAGGRVQWVHSWARTFETRLWAGGGLVAGVLNSTLAGAVSGESVGWGWAPFGTTGAGGSLWLTPRWSLGLQTSVRYDPVTRLSVQAAVSVAYDPAGNRPQLTLSSLETAPVFPVFQKYYADQPGLRLTLSNGERFSVHDLKVRSVAPGWVEPTAFSVAPVLAPGESRTVLVPVPWSATLLDNRESTQRSLDVKVSYTVAGETREVTVSTPAAVFGRNSFVWRPETAQEPVDPLRAVLWADDGKVAALIDGSDPRLIGLAQRLRQSWESGSGPDGLNQSLRSLLGVYSFLSERRLRYQPDPRLPAYGTSRRELTVDYLRFPAETLEVGYGDCDDLTVLAASLLEASGVSTAVITVPGHLYLAVDTGLTPGTWDTQFVSPDHLVLQEGRYWLPIEVTSLDKDFNTAWRNGWDEWNGAPAERRLFPNRRSWEQFSPVRGPSAGEPAWTVPALAGRFRDFRTQWGALELKAAESAAVPASLVQKARIQLRFGQLAQSRSLLEQALSSGPTYPLCMNLGLVCFLSQQNDDALRYYQMARNLRPTAEVATALELVRQARPVYRLVLGTGESGGVRGDESGVQLAWEEDR